MRNTAEAAARVDDARAAQAALPPELVYVDDLQPGYRRVLRGQHFAYRDDRGRWLRDPQHIERIRKLAIPPAYTAVWICSLPNGHLQATGRDARGRKQYRYHEAFRQLREAHKFDRLAAFGLALPKIRRRVEADLQLRAGESPTRAVVLATLVRLLDTTFLRIGNRAYARDNGSFGLTTLRSRHVKVEAGRLRLRFRGKSGVEADVTVDDPRLARAVRRCQQLPGQALFRYVDDSGQLVDISSTDVNDYLHEAAGERFTAKDFRTWHGSVQALELVRVARMTQETTTSISIVREVARQLGNTVAVCRKAYIHPTVLELAATLKEAETGGPGTEAWALITRAAAGLTAPERRLLSVLALAGREATRHEPATPLKRRAPRR